jgi:Fic family protein
VTGWHPDKPFDALPLLPPKAELETIPILRACITARAALGELKQAARVIPNQSILINSLPLLEARASSEIENIVTTTDKIFRGARNEAQADPATKEALRYGRALFEGYQSLTQHPINTRTAERICSTIKGVEMAVRRIPGTALADETTGNVIYTPPHREAHLRSLLGNWERFIHEATTIDPLIRLAVGHYQFEAIHPFTDGNGRTGRVINSLMLVQEGLLTLPVLYLSRYLIENRKDYYRLLLDVTKNERWELWIIFIIRGIAETARWTTAKIEAIDDLSKHTASYVRERLPKIYSRDLVDVIFHLPYCRIQDVAEAGLGHRQTAAGYLRQLVGIGVLKELDVGREKLFLHEKLLHLLSYDNNAFAPYATP